MWSREQETATIHLIPATCPERNDGIRGKNPARTEPDGRRYIRVVAFFRNGHCEFTHDRSRHSSWNDTRLVIARRPQADEAISPSSNGTIFTTMSLRAAPLLAASPPGEAQSPSAQRETAFLSLRSGQAVARKQRSLAATRSVSLVAPSSRLREAQSLVSSARFHRCQAHHTPILQQP